MMQRRPRVGRIWYGGLACVQLACLAVSAWLHSRSGLLWFWLPVRLAAVAAALVLRRGGPADAAVMLAAPVFALLRSLALCPRRRTRRLYARVARTLAAGPEPDGGALERLRTENPAAGAQAAGLQALGCPVWYGSETVYYASGSAGAMTAAARQAGRSLYWCAPARGPVWQTLEPVLLQRAQQGVDVRLLLPGASRRMAARLRRAGVRVCLLPRGAAAPELFAADGQLSFCGPLTPPPGGRTGILCLQGSAAAAWQRVFLAWWQALSPGTDAALWCGAADCGGYGYVQPFWGGPAQAAGREAVCNLIGRAERQLLLAAPTLRPAPEVEQALCRAARSGVRVRIVCAELPDSPALRRLQRAGVQLSAFSGALSARLCCADGSCAIVGASGLDPEPELWGVWLYGAAAVAPIAADLARLHRRATAPPRQAA